MEYLFVLTLIALSVVVGFLMTYWDQDKPNDSKPDNKNATTKKTSSFPERGEAEDE